MTERELFDRLEAAASGRIPALKECQEYLNLGAPLLVMGHFLFF